MPENPPVQLELPFPFPELFGDMLLLAAGMSDELVGWISKAHPRLKGIRKKGGCGQGLIHPTVADGYGRPWSVYPGYGAGIMILSQKG